MSYEYGYIRVWGNEQSGANAPGWLGVKDDAQAIGNLCANGGIATANATKNPDGTLHSIDVAHVWVQLQIGGTTYVFDPSFKQHTVASGARQLRLVLRYTHRATKAARSAGTRRG